MDYQQIRDRNLLVMVAYLITWLGHQWVVVFFVLSGYLVGGSVLRQVAANRWTWGGYALTRLTRLYTVLIPALVLGGLADLLGLRMFGTAGIYGDHTGAHEIFGGIAVRLSLPILFGNYFFLQAIRVPVLGSNNPLWSLSYEFWYYAAFPLLVYAFWRKRNVAPRLISALLLAVLAFFVGEKIAPAGLIWLMGVTIHWLPVRKPATVLKARVLLGGVISLTVVTLACCKQYHTAVFDFVLGAVVSVLIYAILSCSEDRLSPIYTYLAQHTARSSYTLYLVHVPALVFLTAWIGQQRWQPDGRHLLFAFGILAVVFVYAQIVYLSFERNTGAIRRWLKPRIMKSSPGHQVE
jgi:peptidoglycan/LPS O-acetylase OafA/YrhL